MPEEITDNEFYLVIYTNNDHNHPSSVFIHLRYGETIFHYMQRELGIDADKIDQIYKRTYVKQ